MLDYGIIFSENAPHVGVVQGRTIDGSENDFCCCIRI